MAAPRSEAPLPGPETLSAWQKLVVENHETLVEKRGEGWPAFWGSEASQKDRYRVFFDELSLDDAEVLEIGCGFGDFLTYAAERKVRPRRYLGADLSERMIAAAHRRHPHHDFAVLDILKSPPPFAPDYIIASGIAAIDLPGYEDYVLAILRRFHVLSRIGFALNFLSTATKKPDGHSRYVEPAWVLALFQRHIDWRCRLIHDYRPNDFTIVYKRVSPT